MTTVWLIWVWFLARKIKYSLKSQVKLRLKSQHHPKKNPRPPLCKSHTDETPTNYQVFGCSAVAPSQSEPNIFIMMGFSSSDALEIQHSPSFYFVLPSENLRHSGKPHDHFESRWLPWFLSSSFGWQVPMKLLNIVSNSFRCSVYGERLVSAARDGDLLEAKALLECNPCLVRYSTLGVRNSPLHYAAAQGHHEVIQWSIPLWFDKQLISFFVIMGSMNCFLMVLCCSAGLDCFSIAGVRGGC